MTLVTHVTHVMHVKHLTHVARLIASSCLTFTHFKFGHRQTHQCCGFHCVNLNHTDFLVGMHLGEPLTLTCTVNHLNLQYTTGNGSEIYINLQCIDFRILEISTTQAE